MAAEKDKDKHAPHIDELGKMLQLITELHKQQKPVGDEREVLFHEKKEITKAHRCLCQMIQLTENISLGFDQCLQEALDLVQGAWQYPDETSARIIYDQRTYTTSNFIIETEWRHEAPIKILDKEVGKFEVFYMEKTPEEFVGKLMWERPEMVQAFADGIGLIIGRFEAREQHETLKEVLDQARQTEKKYAARIARNLPKLKRIKQVADESIHVTNRFLAAISEELLASINHVISSINDSVESGAEPPGEWKNIKASSKHISQIVGQIHDYADIETKPFKQNNSEFNLSLVIEELIAPLYKKARAKGIDLVNFTSPVIPEKLVGDVTKLRQILTNLVENAINRTESGDISIGVELEATPHLLPIFHFIIADSGPEIKDDDISRYFEPFEREIAGSSSYDIHCRLGRSISKKLVEFMGGEIWFENAFHFDKDNHPGASIHYTMWMDITAGQKHDSALSSIDSIALNAIVVEQKELYKRYFRIMLENAGISPIFADTYEAAVSTLKSRNFKNTDIPFAIIRGSAEVIFDNPLINYLSKSDNEKNVRIIAISEPGESQSEIPEFSPIEALLTKPIRKTELVKSINDIIKTYLEANARPEPEPPQEMPPLYQESSPAALTEIPAESALIRESAAPLIRILMAESSDSRRTIIEKLLTKRGHTVSLFNDGRQAIDNIRSGAFDMLLLDVDIPVIGGVEIIKLVRSWEKQNNTYIPIITFTVQDNAIESKLCLDAGADECLPAQTGVKEILACVEKLAQNRFEEEKDPFSETVPIDISLLSINKFDSDAALALIDNDNEMLIELLEIFADDCRNYIQELEPAVASQNYDSIADYAHRIEKAAGSVGAKVIGIVAQRLAIAADKHEDPEFTSGLTRLTEEIAAFNREARIFEQSCQQQGQSTT